VPYLKHTEKRVGEEVLMIDVGVLQLKLEAEILAEKERLLQLLEAVNSSLSSVDDLDSAFQDLKNALAEGSNEDKEIER